MHRTITGLLLWSFLAVLPFRTDGAVASERQEVKADAVQASADAASATQIAAKATFTPLRFCGVCPLVIALPPGRFLMGSARGDFSEKPQHVVTINYGFAIGQYEVTVAEWMACVEDGGCSYRPRPVDEPEKTAVRNVSWTDVQEYLTWLSVANGRIYRLPSEAEWEYAARGGTQAEYWWGDSVSSGQADCKDCGGPWSRKAPRTIASHQANPFKLYDMNGGVSEWTADCWFRDHSGAPGDGSWREPADCRQRVLRGGSWRDSAEYLRSAARHSYDADVRYLAHGFRIAVTLEQ